MKNRKIFSTVSLVASLLAFALSSQLSAEGIASMTTVTRENATTLEHHRLDIIRKSQNGKSYIAIEVRNVEGNPKTDCFVTIYDQSGEKVMIQFDSAAGIAPSRDRLAKGSRAYFHVSDDLIDSVEIRYHLPANESQSHVFTIPRGSLAKLANLR